MRRVVLALALFLAVVFAVLITIGFIMSRRMPTPTQPDSPGVTTLDIPRGNLYGGPSFGRQLDISPDGKRIVYVGQAGKGSRTLFVHTMGEKAPTEIPGIDGGNRDIRDPTFSPDGRYVVYWAQGNVKRSLSTGKFPLSKKLPPPEVSAGSIATRSCSAILKERC